MKEMKFCPHCGEKIEGQGSISFCPFCGKLVAPFANSGAAGLEEKARETVTTIDSGKLKEAKYFGGIGSFAPIFQLVPVIGWVLTLVLVVVQAIGVKMISDFLRRSEIFKNYLIGMAFDLAALPIALLFLVGHFRALTMLYGEGMGMTEENFASVVSIPFLLAGLVAVGCVVTCCYFWRKSFRIIAEATRITTFRTAGDILFISSFFLVILVGAVGILAGFIVLAIAFFSLEERNLPKRVRNFAPLSGGTVSTDTASSESFGTFRVAPSDTEGGLENGRLTDLMIAAEQGDIEKVQNLLANGANVNVRNKVGWTALMFAARNGHTDITRALLAKGADINAKTNESQSARMFAEREGRLEIVNLLKKAGAIE